MKYLFFSLMLLGAPAMAQQFTLVDKDGYALGPGNWTCARTVEVAMGEGGQDKSALIGWIMGAWSLSTFVRSPEYSDLIEQVGGETIYIESVKRCQSAPPEELLHTVVRAMIDNTGVE